MNSQNVKVDTTNGIYYVRMLTESEMYARCLIATIVLFILFLMVFMEFVLVIAGWLAEDNADFWTATIRMALFIPAMMLIHTDTC